MSDVEERLAPTPDELDEDEERLAPHPDEEESVPAPEGQAVPTYIGPSERETSLLSDSWDAIRDELGRLGVGDAASGFVNGALMNYGDELESLGIGDALGHKLARMFHPELPDTKPTGLTPLKDAQKTTSGQVGQLAGNLAMAAYLGAGTAGLGTAGPMGTVTQGLIGAGQNLASGIGAREGQDRFDLGDMSLDVALGGLGGAGGRVVGNKLAQRAAMKANVARGARPGTAPNPFVSGKAFQLAPEAPPSPVVTPDVPPAPYEPLPDLDVPQPSPGLELSRMPGEAPPSSGPAWSELDEGLASLDLEDVTPPPAPQAPAPPPGLELDTEALATSRRRGRIGYNVMPPAPPERSFLQHAGEFAFPSSTARGAAVRGMADSWVNNTARNAKGQIAHIQAVQAAASGANAAATQSRSAVAGPNVATVTWALQSVNSAGDTGFSPADQKMVDEALVNPDPAKIPQIYTRLASKYPKFQKRLEAAINSAHRE